MSPGSSSGTSREPRESRELVAAIAARLRATRTAEPGSAFRDAAAKVKPVDSRALAQAFAHHETLTKPPGSLGVLEELGARLSAISGACPPPIPEPVAVTVFAGDHGVLTEGVSPWPVEVTAQMVANFVGGGAAINAIARQAGADVVVIDVGVASGLEALHGAPGFVAAKIRPGTGNIAEEPAMTHDQALQALDVGVTVAGGLAEAGFGCLVTGDMGIGNTTPSAALIAAFCGRPAAEVTGRGTGIDDARLEQKVRVVERALGRSGVQPGTPVVAQAGALDALASLGGLEIAAIAGCIVGGAAQRLPVVVDGVIAAAAALVAAALVPEATGYMVAGHRSVEPGATVALEQLSLEPVLDLRMRLGEGTGACLAVPVLQAAARVLGEMATFDSAGVSSKQG